jgi:hypothetical protein
MTSTATTSTVADRVRPTSGQQGAGQEGDELRGKADRCACWVLRVPARAGDAEVYNLFSSSILLSATRCLLSYIVFPVLAPWLSAAPVVGPAIGIPVAAAALVFDVRAVRKFFLAHHRWRWAAAVLYTVVMAMVLGLLVHDVTQLA